MTLLQSLTPHARYALAAARLRAAATGAGRVPLPTTHPGQDTVLASPARYRVLNCGRRWRKSSTALHALIRAAEDARRRLLWWVWPTGPMGQTGWDMLRAAVGGRWQVSESRRRVIAPTGSEIWVKSADHEDSLRGAGLDGLVIDECRDVAARAWREVLRPALADRQGWAMFLSTPRGIDWFHDLYHAAADAPDWAAWTFPTWTNPDIPQSEIDAARADMPERLFRQELGAEFIQDAGAVFRNIEACCTVAAPAAPDDHKDCQVVLGVDWGKRNDFTVITAACRQHRVVVDWDRFNQIDYHVQRQRLALMAERWRAMHILVESNSIGEPNLEELQRGGLPVSGFETTATSKPPLIESLALALERGELAAPVEYAGELRAYEMQRNEHTGRPRYGAPDGQHDDRVMSLALALKAVDEGRLQLW